MSLVRIFCWPTVMIALSFNCVSCGPSPECLEACRALGVEAESAACQELCTGDCRELSERFGLSVERCQRLQREGL